MSDADQPRASNQQADDRFTCGRCQQQFDQLLTFLSHRVVHTNSDGDFECELCPEGFPSKGKILEHYTDYHKIHVPNDGSEEKPYRIIEVGETEGKIVAIVSDPEAVHIDEEAEKVYDLLVRQKVPDTATDSYLRHKINYKLAVEVTTVRGNKFSYGKTLFRCLFCLYQFNDIITLSRHMFNIHKDFVNNFKVEKYERAFFENNKKRDGSEYAGQILSLAKYRASHQRKSLGHVGGKLKRGRKRKLAPDSYPCQTCGKVFKRARLRRSHMATHRTERNFLCDECGKAFKSRACLTAHRRTHREKIFRCQQCDFQSKLNSAIQAHRQIHSQGCVLCHVCGAAYMCRSTLTKHMAVHSMDRPYPCTFTGCTWRFKTEAMCKGHFRAHTTMGRFKCQICDYRFRHKHHLRRHLTSVHQELLKPQTSQEGGILPSTSGEEDSGKAVPDQLEEGGTSNMQMIQVVLNQQVHQEVVAGNIQGLQVFKLFTMEQCS